MNSCLKKKKHSPTRFLLGQLNVFMEMLVLMFAGKIFQENLFDFHCSWKFLIPSLNVKLLKNFKLADHFKLLTSSF